MFDETFFKRQWQITDIIHHTNLTGTLEKTLQVKEGGEEYSTYRIYLKGLSWLVADEEFTMQQFLQKKKQRLNTCEAVSTKWKKLRRVTILESRCALQEFNIILLQKTMNCCDLDINDFKFPYAHFHSETEAMADWKVENSYNNQAKMWHVCNVLCIV